MDDSISPVSIANAEHYVWGDACDGWHLLKHPDLSVIQERVPPGVGEVKHYHLRARQFFYVLSGSAVVEWEQGAVALETGQGAHVPPGVAHRFVNASAAEVVFLVISAPPSHSDRYPVGATGEA